MVQKRVPTDPGPTARKGHSNRDTSTNTQNGRVEVGESPERGHTKHADQCKKLKTKRIDQRATKKGENHGLLLCGIRNKR